MNIDSASKKIDEKITFIDPNGVDFNGIGGKERYLNQRGLKNNKIEISLKDFIMSSGFDG